MYRGTWKTTQYSSTYLGYGANRWYDFIFLSNPSGKQNRLSKSWIPSSLSPSFLSIGNPTLNVIMYHTNPCLYIRIYVYGYINNMWYYFVGFKSLQKWYRVVFIFMWSFLFHSFLPLHSITMNDWTVYLSISLSADSFQFFATINNSAGNILMCMASCNCARVPTIYV